jgi:glycosyltransferase involved in cell wall biosynthesis
MKFVFTSYAGTPGYNQPESWLKRIEAYTGILESLAKDHKVIGIERINYEGDYEQKGVQYIFLKQTKRTVYFPRRIHQLIKKLEPDVVFINGFIFPFQVLQLKRIVGKKVKIIILHRAEKPFTGIKRYVQKLADKCVDAYLFTSAEFSREWEKNITIQKIHEVIQASSIFFPVNKVEATKITNVKGFPVFLWVGMLISRKDPLTVVKAFLEFVSHQPEAKLYMIYQSGELLEEIKLLLQENQYGAAIVLTGPIPHEQLLNWYNSADFFITASRYEGSGVALSEAMSCGCIPITSNFISFKKMTGPGKCGLMFETGNEKDLLNTLLKTKDMDIEKERDRVLKQFNEELSFEAIAGKIDTIIASL